jgi:hypothetical protein
LLNLATGVAQLRDGSLMSTGGSMLEHLTVMQQSRVWMWLFHSPAQKTVSFEVGCPLEKWLSTVHWPLRGRQGKKNLQISNNIPVYGEK